MSSTEPATDRLVFEIKHLNDLTSVIPETLLDLRPDSAIIETILTPQPVKSEKNIWAFWDKGWSNMRPWSKRNVICWARRLLPRGWTIRVLDLVPDSPFHVNIYLDMNIFPAALRQGTMTGSYAPQHMSDHIRVPLLYQHGGCWVDVGALLFGDVEALWQVICDTETPYKLAAFTVTGRPKEYSMLANTFILSRKGDEFLKRWHDVFYALWEGRTNADGLNQDLLISWLGRFPLDGLGPDEDAFHGSATLTDYLAQMMCAERLVLLEDPNDGWSGRKYWEECIFNLRDEEMSFAHNAVQHNGEKLFDLLSTPFNDAKSSAVQLLNTTVTNTWMLKVYHGPVMSVPTLGYLWDRPENVDADILPGSCASFLRFAMIHLKQTRPLISTPTDKIPDDYVLIAGVSERKEKTLVRRALK